MLGNQDDVQAPGRIAWTEGLYGLCLPLTALRLLEWAISFRTGETQQEIQPLS